MSRAIENSFDGFEAELGGNCALGEDFLHNFSKTTSIQQKIRFYPNVSNSGNYRMNFDTTFATAVAKWFSLQFTVSDRYLSNPVPGRKTNDVLYSAGVRLSFAQ